MIARLGELREKHAVKQEVVAIQMDVQAPAVSKIENKPIHALTLARLQDYIHAMGGNLTITIDLHGEVHEL